MKSPEQVPFASAVDKVEECCYFLGMMMFEYHSPKPFRYNLNAFLQSLRSVTDMLKEDDHKPVGFDRWFSKAMEGLMSDTLLRAFKDSRDMVVHWNMLETMSECSIGLFRGRQFKLGVGGQVPLGVDSKVYLNRAKQHAFGHILNKDHAIVGEQLGVQRKWVVEKIGKDEIVGLCVKALSEMGSIVSQTVSLAGGDFVPDLEMPPEERYTVLLETDVDPSLVEKWSW